MIRRLPFLSISHIIRGEFWQQWNARHAYDGGVETTGLASFIQDRIMAQPFSSADKNVGFLKANDLQIALKKYIEQTENLELQEIDEERLLARKGTVLQKEFIKVMEDAFGFECQYRRLTKNNTYEEGRPHGYFNIALRPTKMKVAPEGCRFFEVKMGTKDDEELPV